jgi:hypothetical protein
MLKKIRDFGYDGLVWGLNSGVDSNLMTTGRLFNVEDVHVYWDHPYDKTFLNTSGVRQFWQFPPRRFTGRPWFCTEWGSLPYNRFRGETGLFFAAMMASSKASCVLSYALATNEGQMSSRLAPIDQMAFHTDPVRLATERAMVLLLRQPDSKVQTAWNKKEGLFTYKSPLYDLAIQGQDSNRRADFLASLDGKPTGMSSHMLLMRFGDAQNSGFDSHLVKDKVVFAVDNRGAMPVREFPNTDLYEIHTSRKLRAWALNPYTGARGKEVACRQNRPGVWQVKVEGLNTEIEGR